MIRKFFSIGGTLLPPADAFSAQRLQKREIFIKMLRVFYNCMLYYEKHSLFFHIATKESHFIHLLHSCFFHHSKL